MIKLTRMLRGLLCVTGLGAVALGGCFCPGSDLDEAASGLGKAMGKSFGEAIKKGMKAAKERKRQAGLRFKEANAALDGEAPISGNTEEAQQAATQLAAGLTKALRKARIRLPRKADEIRVHGFVNKKSNKLAFLLRLAGVKHLKKKELKLLLREGYRLANELAPRVLNTGGTEYDMAVALRGRMGYAAVAQGKIDQEPELAFGSEISMTDLSEIFAPRLKDPFDGEKKDPPAGKKAAESPSASEES